MAGVTLAEYRRSQQVSDPILGGIVEVYENNAPILGDSRNLGVPLPALRFETTGTDGTGAVSFNTQKALGTTGWRAVDNEFTATTGETEKISTELKIGGGRVTVDRIVKQRANGDVSGLVTQQMMLIASFARNWNKAFYKGDGSSNSILGLQARIETGNQLVDNGGGGLSLYTLDKVLLSVRGTDKVIIGGTEALARLQSAAKSNSNVNYVPENYGVSPATYNGVPLMLAGEDVDESEILDFSEAGDTTSLYVLSLGENGVTGVQSAPLNWFNTNGEKRVDSSYVVEWDNNFIIKTKRSAYRIYNIADAAVNSEPDPVVS